MEGTEVMPEDELVTVMVERKYLGQVYAFIAQLGGHAAELGPTSSSIGGADAKSSLEWSVEDLREIPSSNRESVQRVARMMDVMSANPEKKVPLGELAEEAGLTRGEVQGAFSGFTRWIRSTFNGNDTWPFRAMEGLAVSGGALNEMRYSMDADIASRWNTIRSSTR
jgi:hypothetical protein